MEEAAKVEISEQALTEFDRLYFPHCWTKRYPFNEILERHIQFFNENSESLKTLVKCEFNVPYGYGQREQYDIVGIDLPEDAPILVYIHGGYWQIKEITHSNQIFIAKVLHKHKIKVITLGYELCPNVTLPEIMNKICVAFKRCIDYARKKNSKGIYLLGHSVGAQLALSIYTKLFPLLSKDDQQLLKGVFLSCGLYDVTPITKTIINQQLGLDEETAKTISPEHNVFSSSKAIFHVLTAENESPAFLEQGKKFHEKLIESGIRCEYHQLDGVDHFNAIERMIDEDFDLVKLIVETVAQNCSHD
ncbi:kynurenine formamidase isoform X1 [Cylas formicarius]|uniref:kynurenine formamidase isoform X1 n=1 Tax=Cylas formicarius TaxID=197179 RepID=UPI002958342A|nr:kynurenine formamidase isoform X1 [Cylas formicarius]